MSLSLVKKKIGAVLLGRAVASGVRKLPRELARFLLQTALIFASINLVVPVKLNGAVVSVGFKGDHIEVNNVPVVKIPTDVEALSHE